MCHACGICSAGPIDFIWSWIEHFHSSSTLFLKVDSSHVFITGLVDIQSKTFYDIDFSSSRLSFSLPAIIGRVLLLSVNWTFIHRKVYFTVIRLSAWPATYCVVSHCVCGAHPSHTLVWKAYQLFPLQTWCIFFSPFIFGKNRRLISMTDLPTGQSEESSKPWTRSPVSWFSFHFYFLFFTIKWLKYL